DRLLADPFGKTPDHVERDVGLQQRAAHLAHRSIDVSLRQRPAPRQPIEYAAKLFRQIVEHVSCSFVVSLLSYPAKAGYPVLRDLALQRTLPVTGSPAFAGDDGLTCVSLRASATPSRSSKHVCARGRIALSGVDLRPRGPGGGSKRTSFR